MKWRDLPGKSRISHLYLDFGTSNLYMQCHNKSTRNYLFVTREEFNCCVDTVERQFAGMFVSKLIEFFYLSHRFNLVLEAHVACR